MRIIAMSDQHGELPATPEGDVLVVAGDLCPDIFGGAYANSYPGVGRQFHWLANRWQPWLQSQPATHKAATYGNHDFCGETLPIGTDSVSNIYVDTLVILMGKRFWFSPWSPTFMQWAWMRNEAELARIYANIPDDIDVLVSHSPPRSCGDSFIEITPLGERVCSVGSIALADAIRRVRPQVVICGHIHSGHGQHMLDDIPVYNVSVVNEGYQLINQPTIIDL